MTFAISKDTERDDIEDTIGASVDRESVRTSEAREVRITKNVRRQARDWGTSVAIDEDHPTAHVEHTPNESPHVVVTGRAIPQPTTDYDERAWDWMAQRAFGVHEVGHIRYTDFEDADARITSLPSADRGFAHSADNAFEDGAIEKQLTERWPNYYDILRSLRANIFADTNPGIADPEQGGYVFPLAHAMHSAILDLWTREVYDLNIGTLDALLDDSDDEFHFASADDRELFETEALPIIEAAIPDVLSTPDAKQRNEVKFEAIEKLADLLEDADADGRSQQNGQDGQGSDGAGMPDDSRDNHSGEAQASADELGDVDPDDVAESMAGDDGVDADDLDDDTDAVTPGSGAGDLDDLADVETDATLDSEATEQANDDAREVSGVTSDMLDELDELTDMFDSGGRDLNSQSLEVLQNSGDYHAGRYEESKAASQRLAQLLRQRLQAERRTETKRNRRRGRLDSTSLHRTKTGETAVKMRKDEPDEKDYHCVVALDRSGSMTGSEVEGAETAAGMLLLALEAVGVETMLIDLKDNDARLAKPFRTSTETHKANVFSGATGGSTPMSQVLAISRERLNRTGGNQFMIVVTDGRPDDTEQFEDELGQCTFPVIGVNIVGDMDDDPAGSGHYHREVKTTPGSNLQQALQDLVNEVMF